MLIIRWREHQAKPLYLCPGEYNPFLLIQHQLPGSSVMKAFNYLWTGKRVPILGSQWLELWWPMKFLTTAVAAGPMNVGTVSVKVMVTSVPSTPASKLAESPGLKFRLYVRVPWAPPSIRERKKMVLLIERREILLTGGRPRTFIVVFTLKYLSTSSPWPVLQSNDESIRVGVVCCCLDRRVTARGLWRH